MEFAHDHGWDWLRWCSGLLLMGVSARGCRRAAGEATKEVSGSGLGQEEEHVRGYTLLDGCTQGVLAVGSDMVLRGQR